MGKRQIRVADEVRNTLQNIKIHSNEASTSSQKNAPCYSDLKSNDQDNLCKVSIIDISDIYNDSNVEQTNLNNEISHYILSEMSEILSNGKQDSIGNNENSSLNCNINTILKQWALGKKVSHSVNHLLISLSLLHPSLRLNSRTLLRTPRHLIGFKKLDTGDLCYFGKTKTCSISIVI